MQCILLLLCVSLQSSPKKSLFCVGKSLKEKISFAFLFSLVKPVDHWFCNNIIFDYITSINLFCCKLINKTKSSIVFYFLLDIMITIDSEHQGQIRCKSTDTEIVSFFCSPLKFKFFQVPTMSRFSLYDLAFIILQVLKHARKYAQSTNKDPEDRP